MRPVHLRHRERHQPGRVDLIAVPYDSARRGERMGAGPEALMPRLADRLGAAGCQVRSITVDLPSDSWRAEIRSAFELGRAVARAVRQSRADMAFPLVLSGNCGPAAIGCVSGLDVAPAVCWFDAHGDFNTPDSTIGGFLDGMAVATVTGCAWPQLAKSVDGFRPIDDGTVVLIGTRDLDPLEATLLQRSRIRQVAPEALRSDLGPAVAAVAEARATAYLHLDLDVLDPSEGRVNCYAAPGGLSRDDVAWAIERIGESFEIVAAAMTALDPASDPEHRALDAAVSLGVALVDRASRTQ